MRFFIFPILLFFPLGLQELGRPLRGLASSWDMIPSRSLAGLHYIFRDYNIDEDLGVVMVQGPVIEITSGAHLQSKVHPLGYKQEIDLEIFEDEQSLGVSVFETTTRKGNNVATSFLVGKNLVITNRHVMAFGPKEKKKDCGLFKVKLNHRDEHINCSSVRYCSDKFDFCLIELAPMSDGRQIGEEIKPLRLTNQVNQYDEKLFLHIGNAAGMGIQASRGKGLIISQGEFYHYAPTLGGSSGAPIFNEKGEVIGVNWGHTGANYLGDSSFNRGVLSKTIFEELLRKGYYKTIKDIKSFRTWYSRQIQHRRAQILR